MHGSSKMENIFEEWLIINVDRLQKYKNEMFAKLVNRDNTNLDLNMARLSIWYYEYVMTDFVSKHNKFKIVVKKSNIHGNGVFSTSTIKKNEFITFYPCHYIGLKCKKDGKEANLYISRNELSIPENYKDLISRYSLVDYLDRKIQYTADPDIRDDISQVGHIMNHSKTPNACYVRYNGIWTIRAIKKIRAGEEITIFYGEEYGKLLAG
jgi:SET domain-containing protein